MISAGWPAVAANAAANAIVADGADRALVLAADDDRDVAREAEIEDPARLGEAGPRRLHAHDPDRALLERAIDVREADAALIAAQRHRPALGEPQPAGAILDRDRLLDRPHPELDERVAGPYRVVVAPASVGVDVEVGVGQRVADRAHRRDVEVRRAPDLDLEGGRRPSRSLISVASSAIATGSPNETMCAAATSSAKPPSSVWHGQPRIWPTRSQTARSTAPRAT